MRPGQVRDSAKTVARLRAVAEVDPPASQPWIPKVKDQEISLWGYRQEVARRIHREETEAAHRAWQPHDSEVCNLCGPIEGPMRTIGSIPEPQRHKKKSKAKRMAYQAAKSEWEAAREADRLAARKRANNRRGKKK